MMTALDSREDRSLQAFPRPPGFTLDRSASLGSGRSTRQLVTQEKDIAPCSSPICFHGNENSTSPQLLSPSKENVCGTSQQLPSSERRQRRKPLHPRKSPSLTDPDFCGVTLCFHTVLHGGSSELIITPIFSKNLVPLERRRRHRRGNSESDPDGGHSTPEENPVSCDEQCSPAASATLSSGVKSCASCATRRTPLWRDAEDGTPLCNACGIRYRKYRLRCSTCWHIPRKDNKVFPACSRCGGVLRVSQAKKC